MTPMIDVVFLLLVFFICASVGGTADHLLPAELNGTTASSQAERPAEQAADWEHPAIQIRMEPGPTGPKILLDNQLLPDSEALTERLTLLAAADAESKIILNIQDEIQVQQFIHVYDLCQSLKFQNISFAVAARDEAK
jgi:biopolymer transport protein ExbD